MRAFTCGVCGQLLFFENSRCLRCSHPLGFVPSKLDIVVLDEPDASLLRRCANAELAHCNWVLEEGDPGPLCRSCRLTRTRPADGDAEGLAAFVTAEAAKRRLIFQLLESGYKASVAKAWGAAFTLMALILLANIGARVWLRRSERKRGL